ncbi:hypothetical protein ABVK25_005557 [Lepraria finkii]|uniref:Killer toxin Kp4 domain-containing protein n=1 Tax=Lepraria finkii TaxID=1340010 RepID=A0ABR4B9B2_9LECA
MPKFWACFISHAREAAGGLDDNAIYSPAANIACAYLWTSAAAFCAFPQGRVAMPGVSERVIKRKIVQLMGYGCFACGSVPWGQGAEEDKGLLTVNYVSQAVRNGRPGQVVCDPIIPPPQ